MRDINKLHPRLESLCRELVELAKDKGIEIIITQTLRTQEEQEALYAQGRTKPGSIVTQVNYPYSFHCWGLAFDFAVKVNGEVNWNRLDLYDKVGEIGKSIGLIWGGDFKSIKDRPHFELPGFNIKELIAKYGTPSEFIAAFKEEKSIFMDLADHWAKADVAWLMEKGIIQRAQKYRPDEPITRAEAAAMVARAIQFVLADE